MNEEIELILEETKSEMSKTVEHLKIEFSRIRTGRASTALLDGVYVEAYGASTPVNQVANIGTPDGKTITIQPWDKSMIGAIEKGILQSNIGLNPQNDGEMIRLFLPPMTEERRKDLVKQIKQMAEQAKVSIRNHRRDSNEMIKKLQKDGLAEDAAKDAEASVQKLTDEHIVLTDKVVEVKEKEIMTI